MGNLRRSVISPLVLALLPIVCSQGVHAAEWAAGKTSPTGYVQFNGLTWMPNSIIRNGAGADWSAANTYCTTEKINGKTGWRLPTKEELESLYSSMPLKGKQHWVWTLTWSGTPSGPGMHIAVGQDEGMTDAVGRPTGRYGVPVFSRGDGVWFAVTCVR